MSHYQSILETGGSEIISFSLEWDGGLQGNTFTSLVGESTNNIQVSYVKDQLTAGVVYNFRYRAKNIFGWSPYSQVLS